MIIKDIKITNFKSMYGEHYFNFIDLEGLVKLSGPIGAGKTSLGEAIIYGLYGNVKDHKIPNLVSWNCRECTVEMNLVCKNREIHIVRCNCSPLVVEVNGKTLAAPSKNDIQNLLEEEFYDVPKLAIEKMCIISFNQFNSLASMSAGETKQFLDEVFGFKTFSDYNDKVVVELKDVRKVQYDNQAVYADTIKQIENLKNKKAQQQAELSSSINIDGIAETKQRIIEDGKELRAKKDELTTKYNSEYSVLNNQRTEIMTLGKVAKEWYNKFKSGTCPTCGHPINATDLEEHKNKIQEYATQYREVDAKINELTTKYNSEVSVYDEQLKNMRAELQNIETKVRMYENSQRLISENYDSLISEYEDKANSLKEQIDKADIEIGEWNELNELFTKTLRYKLLDTLVPHINSSIQQYLNKLNMNYRIQFDQEFKSHIYVDGYDKDISYKDLSTGQRKTLDIAIIFGILQNVIANVNCNVFFLDELFSNMDADARSTMLEVLHTSLAKDRCIFVINHAEMPDDFFEHKMRVALHNKRIDVKKTEHIVKASKYEKVF